MLIGGGAGWGLHHLTPASYRAEAVLLVNIQSLRIGADGVPMDVELVLPARRLVGTVCESDRAMKLLASALAGEDAGEQSGGLLQGKLYFDQRGLEMAALRVVDGDPKRAARIANTWARVSQGLLRQAYGTSIEEVEAIEQRIALAKEEVLTGQAALAEAGNDLSPAKRLDFADRVDRATQRLAELNKRHAQLTVRLEDSKQVARIVSLAEAPAEPTNASMRLIVGLFAFAGLLLGVALALIRGPITEP